MSLVGTSKPRFLKPGEIQKLFEEDVEDTDPIGNTTFVYNANISLSYEQQRQRLPIFHYRNHILYLLEKYQTLVLVGETGCGKSTQIPQYLYEAGWTSDGKMVGITEPRRVAVTTLASRVAEEKGSLLGGLVGYSIRFDNQLDPATTRIKYMTEGILLREMMSDPLLRDYSVIMLDEVHERTMYTDIIMGLLKKIIKKNKHLKLIIASATVDAEEIKRFFNLNVTNDKGLDTAVIMTVAGRTYSVDIFYSAEPVPDYVQGVVNTVFKIHKNEIEGDILAFLCGQEEVEKAVSVIKEGLDFKGRNELKLLVLPMYGSLPYNEQLKVFRPTPRGERKVIIATNIAESSITIPGVVYVIDAGFVKLKWFNPNTYTDSLVVVPVSKASAEQRAGRAGRIRPGKAFRLYREAEYEQLSSSTPPDMQRTELSSAVLQLKALGIHNILRFNFPSPPPAVNFVSAVELLFALGAIDENGDLTKPIGERMCEFPLHPVFSKALLNSETFGCTQEVISILSMLQIQNVFTKPSRGQAAIEAKVFKRKFEVSEGDPITLLNVYQAYVKYGRSKDWCYKHFLNYKGLRRADEIRSQIESLLRKFDISFSSADGDTDSVCRALTSGLFPNAAYLHHSGVYKSIRGEQDLYIHPTSVLYTLQQPQWVLYCDVMLTNKAYMKNILAVEPSWLEELAPHFYQKTREYS